MCHSFRCYQQGITGGVSFNSLNHRTVKWKSAAEEVSNFVDGGKLPCLLVENKCDLLEESEQEDVTALKEFADKNNYACCFKTSAKTGKNIEESMDFFIKIIINRMESVSNEGNQVFSSERKNVVLEKQTHPSPAKEKKNKDNCC